MNIKPKTLLITGASSGLGAGMAREFAARGHNLALCARRTERLLALQAELQQAHGVRVEIRALDVNDYAQVFVVFEDLALTFGHLDCIIVNAGIGEGRRIGTGHFETNRRTAETNFVAALAQCEAAVGIFRRQNAGHLVTTASMSAMRGMAKNITTYAASKAGLAHLTEGIRAELINTPIKVTTLLPGYIRTELNAAVPGKLPFEGDFKDAIKGLVNAIERQRVLAYVPYWPWRLVGLIMRYAPLRWVTKMS